MTELLFVYGTLRPGSGHPMSEWLAARSRRLGGAQVRGRLLRVSYYPGLVAGGDWVKGDVLELEPLQAETTLAGLDAFEVCRWQDDDEFRREPGPVELDNGQLVEAWIYWFRGEGEGLAPVPGGDWLASA